METNDIASNEDDEMTKRSKRAVNHSDLAQKTFWEIALNVSATFRGQYHVETLSFPPSLLTQGASSTISDGNTTSDDNTTSDQVQNETSHR